MNNVYDDIPALVEQDLNRSGLTVDDISGLEMLAGPDLVPLDDLDDRDGGPSSDDIDSSCGGYTILYYAFDGSPVLDNGQPFQRTRRLGFQSGPKYLSPTGSHAHVYFPANLHDALACNKSWNDVLVITEGEKKAIAACKAGIPTIALAGIAMYQRHGELLPELQEFLSFAAERNAAVGGNADLKVIVLFDSNGFPMKRESMPKNAESFGSGGTTHKVKPGVYVLNPDVYHHALKCADLIRSSIPGLQVATGWVSPETEEAVGPRGGKYLMLKSKSTGIDDVLVAGGAKELHEKIEYLAKTATARVPISETSGFTPLGFAGDGLTSVIWSKPTDSLLSLANRDLTNIGLLTGAMGMDYLNGRFGIYNDEGQMVGLDTKGAAQTIIDDCHKAGYFDDSERVFGTGTWMDKKQGLLINTSESLLQPDGVAMPRIDAENRGPRGAIYTREGAHTPPEYRNVSDQEYQSVVGRILQDLRTWTYASEIGPELVLGWLFMSIFLGASPSRPSIWLVAPRGSGKTQLARYLKACLGGYGWHTDMAKESTAAGIRQMLQRSSSPCIMDEMEKDNTEGYAGGERSAAAILSLLRSAYSADSEVRKGTADQIGKAFKIMTSFCLVSISDPALEPADLTRIAKIRMLPIHHGGKLGKPPVPLNEDEAAAFFWGSIQRWQQYNDLLDATRSDWLDVAGNGEARECDTFGTLLAASAAAQGCPVEGVRPVLDAAMPHLEEQLQDVREASSEAHLILNTLLSLQTRVRVEEFDEGGKTRTLSQDRTLARLLCDARYHRCSESSAALAGIGVKVVADGPDARVAIAVRHASLAALLRNTRWNKDGAWVAGLAETEGAEKNRWVWLDGKSRRCVVLPWSATGLTPKDPDRIDKPLPENVVRLTQKAQDRVATTSVIGNVVAKVQQVPPVSAPKPTAAPMNKAVVPNVEPDEQAGEDWALLDEPDLDALVDAVPGFDDLTLTKPSEKLSEPLSMPTSATTTPPDSQKPVAEPAKRSTGYPVADGYKGALEVPDIKSMTKEELWDYATNWKRSDARRSETDWLL